MAYVVQELAERELRPAFDQEADVFSGIRWGFHDHPDTFRQAATQDYSLPSTSFIAAKRSS